jgi:hypothetical protein
MDYLFQNRFDYLNSSIFGILNNIWRYLYRHGRVRTREFFSAMAKIALEKRENRVFNVYDNHLKPC